METQPSKIGVPWGSYINFQPTKRRAKPSPLATNCSKAQRKENAQPSERIFRVMKTNAHGDWAHHVPSQCHIKQGKIVKVCQFMLIHALSMLGTCLCSFSPSFAQVFRSSGNVCWSYNPCIRGIGCVEICMACHGCSLVERRVKKTHSARSLKGKGVGSSKVGEIAST